MKLIIDLPHSFIFLISLFEVIAGSPRKFFAPCSRNSGIRSIYVSSCSSYEIVKNRETCILKKGSYVSIGIHMIPHYSARTLRGESHFIGDNTSLGPISLDICDLIRPRCPITSDKSYNITHSFRVPYLISEGVYNVRFGVKDHRNKQVDCGRIRVKIIW